MQGRRDRAPYCLQEPRRRGGRYLGIPQQGVIEGEIANLDHGQRGGRPMTGRGRVAVPSRARDRAWTVLRQNAELMPARQPGMLGDERPPVDDPELAAATLDLDGLPDEGKGHGVAVGVDADEVVLGDDPAPASGVLRCASPPR
jgi:hypothetical protein